MRRLILTLAALLTVVAPSYAANLTSVSSSCPDTGCVVYQTGGRNYISIQLAGTFSATVQFEQSVDGDNYATLPLYADSGLGTAASSATATGIWSRSFSAPYVRVRVSAYTSGTIVANVRADTFPMPSGLSSAATPFTYDGSTFNSPSISLGNGLALQTDVTTAHTALIRAYDVDDATYRNFITLTNGNTPSISLAAPSGGTASVTARLIGAGVPTVADTSANSCGSGTETITGKDNAGKVTVIGSGGTSCTVTFSAAFTTAPACTASNETTAALARATSTTTTVVLAGTFLQNDVIAYVCIGQ